MFVKCVVMSLKPPRKKLTIHFRDPDAIVRSAAVRAVTRTHDRTADEILLEAIRMDPAAPVRAAAVDMAVESGGNVVGSELGVVVNKSGVKIIGYPQLARRVPQHASQMYASNLYNLIEEYWDKERKQLILDPHDEIVQGCLLTRGGEIINQRVKEAYTS